MDSLDWKGIGSAEILNRVKDKLQPGSIILFHNAGENTPKALPGVLEYIISQGYTIVPISEIILPGAYGADYTIDVAGKQCACKPPAAPATPSADTAPNTGTNAEQPNKQATGQAGTEQPPNAQSAPQQPQSKSTK